MKGPYAHLLLRTEEFISGETKIYIVLESEININEVVERIVEVHGKTVDAVIPILQAGRRPPKKRSRPSGGS